MHSSEVHSNESACRRSGRLGLDQVKMPIPDRRRCSTGTVYWYYKQVEEVDDNGTSVGNGVYNTSGVVENHFQKIKKYQVDIDLNATENIFVEEDTVN